MSKDSPLANGVANDRSLGAGLVESQTAVLARRMGHCQNFLHIAVPPASRSLPGRLKWLVKRALRKILRWLLIGQVEFNEAITEYVREESVRLTELHQVVCDVSARLGNLQQTIVNLNARVSHATNELQQRVARLSDQLNQRVARFSDRPEIFLFLQNYYTGGVWQATKDLIHELVAINREQGRLVLTLGVSEPQGDTEDLERLPEGALTIERVRLHTVSRAEVVQMYGGVPAWLAGRAEPAFALPCGPLFSPLRADAWLALVDRFPLPLLPARPYGVMVYDMIQRHVPETFAAVPDFFKEMAVGMVPTLRRADRVFVTTPQTGEDVIEACGLDPARLHLLPVACNLPRRFHEVMPESVRQAREPFILNPTNCNRHKGADVMLRGHAWLKAHLGEATPQLVMCGYYTHAFSPAWSGPQDDAWWQEVRGLVARLGLREGRDVVFLGHVSDGALIDLYQRSSAVVNAALYDNGSFTMLEAAYFGRPGISASYPAAQYVCQRFQVPARFFPPGNGDELGKALHAALSEPRASAAEVVQARKRFLDPEFSIRRYAAHVYEQLLGLAEQGWHERAVRSRRFTSSEAA